MKRKFFVGLFAMLLFCMFFCLSPREKDEPKIYLPSTIPMSIRHAMEEAFPEHEPVAYEMNMLPTFIEPGDLAFAFDVQALPLIDSGANYYFEPLYYDAFVIAVDMNYTKQRIQTWDQLLHMGLPVSIPYSEPHATYLAMSHSASAGEIGTINTHAEWLESLSQHAILRFDDDSAPVQVLLLSEAIAQIRDGRELILSMPEQGGACFAVGLFSKQPLNQDFLEDMELAYKNPIYPKSLSEMSSLVGVQESELFDAGAEWEAFSKIDESASSLRREVLGIRKHSPSDGQGYQLAALVIITLIISSLTYVSYHVVRPEVRRGIWYMGILLVLWICLMLFDYALPEDMYQKTSVALWYLYYLIILTIPIVSIYIAENANRLDRVYFTRKLVVCSTISMLLALMVLTNHYHKMVFHFTAEEPILPMDEYRRNLGYYAIVAWFFVTQIFASAQLLFQNWSSTRKKQMILPMLVFLAGIADFVLYNRHFKPVSDIPFTFSVSLFVITYFALAIYSGLIQSNRYYRPLFEQCTLDMQIYDRGGVLRYRTESGTSNPSDFVLRKRSERHHSELFGNQLIWQHAISGGTLVSKEDISNVLRLQEQLEQATERLERENTILSEKHTVEGRLLLLQAQGRLLSEVNRNTESKIAQMKQILLSDSVSDEHRLKKIHLLSLYCKRRCEQLIHFQSKSEMSGQELVRIILEAADILSPKIATFCRLEGSFSEECSIGLYDNAHDLFLFALNRGLEQVTLKIYQSEGEVIFYAMLDSLEVDAMQELSEFPRASIKDLGDAVSVTLRIPCKGGAR